MKRTIKITDELIENYAAASNDMNPIHLDKHAAKTAGFSDKVAHGMLSMAIAARFVSPLQQGGWLVTWYKMKFTSPLFVHDTLYLQAETTINDMATKIIQLKGANQHETKIINGKIELKYVWDLQNKR